MKYFPDSEPCDQCGAPDYAQCFYCDRPVCEAHAHAIAGRPAILLTCPDCAEKRCGATFFLEAA